MIRNRAAAPDLECYIGRHDRPIFALFETAIGTCGIVWTAREICGVQLPEKDPAATRARVHRRYPTAVEASRMLRRSMRSTALSTLLSGETVI